MTEDEARKNWCPESRGKLNGSLFAVIGNATDQLSDDVLDQIGTDIGESDNCIASDCMAWRWQWHEVKGTHKDPKQGYCGKAGKP